MSVHRLLLATLSGPERRPVTADTPTRLVPCAMDADDLTSNLARYRAKSCTGKACLTARAARRHAIRARAAGEPREAYRCHFADEHDDPSRAWHTGHPLGVSSLTLVAALLRARAGHAPTEPGAGRPDR